MSIKVKITQVLDILNRAACLSLVTDDNYQSVRMAPNPNFIEDGEFLVVWWEDEDTSESCCLEFPTPLGMEVEVVAETCLKLLAGDGKSVIFEPSFACPIASLVRD